MKHWAIALFLAVVAATHTGCGSTRVESLPEESSLKAHLRYLPASKGVTVVSATTNFEGDQAIFLLGFVTGYQDAQQGTLSLIHFEQNKRGRRAEFFGSMGYGVGYKAAQQDKLKQQAESARPTPYEVNL